MLTELRDHPLVAHHITDLRAVGTALEAFRRSATAITRILMLEGSKLLQTDPVKVQTPLEVS